MNAYSTYRIEPDAPKKPTAMDIFGMILQTLFAVVLYVVAIDMMCLLTTWLGGFMFEIGEGNTVIPLHSWRLVAFRAYWVVLGVAVVAALAHKWIVLLTGERESDMCELLGAIESAGAFASVFCAIVCLLGYTAAFDWWAGVTGKMASDSRTNDYLLWAVVLTIGTIVEWRIVEGSLTLYFPMSTSSTGFALHPPAWLLLCLRLYPPRWSSSCARWWWAFLPGFCLHRLRSPWLSRLLALPSL